MTEVITHNAAGAARLLDSDSAAKKALCHWSARLAGPRARPMASRRRGGVARPGVIQVLARACRDAGREARHLNSPNATANAAGRSLFSSSVFTRPPPSARIRRHRPAVFVARSGIDGNEMRASLASFERTSTAPGHATPRPARSDNRDSC